MFFTSQFNYIRMTTVPGVPAIFWRVLLEWIKFGVIQDTTRVIRVWLRGWNKPQTESDCLELRFFTLVFKQPRSQGFFPRKKRNEVGSEVTSNHWMDAWQEMELLLYFCYLLFHADNLWFINVFEHLQNRSDSCWAQLAISSSKPTCCDILAAGSYKNSFSHQVHGKNYTKLIT